MHKLPQSRISWTAHQILIDVTWKNLSWLNCLGDLEMIPASEVPSSTVMLLWVFRKGPRYARVLTHGPRGWVCWERHLGPAVRENTAACDHREPSLPPGVSRAMHRRQDPGNVMLPCPPPQTWQQNRLNREHEQSAHGCLHPFPSMKTNPAFFPEIYVSPF